MYFCLSHGITMAANDYRKGILAVSITAFLWGFLPIILKVALTDLSPIDLTWSRFALAFTILLIYQLIRKPAELKILVRPPLLIVLAALCLCLNYLGLITGVHYTTPAIAEIFIQSGAIFLAITGFVFFREKVTRSQLAGLIIVVAGLGLFYREQIIVFTENVAQYQRGVGLTLLAGLMWTCYAIMQRKLVRNWDPLALNLVLFGLPALFLLPFVSWQAFTSLSLGMWLVVIFLGLNTLIAYGGISYALKYLPATRVSVIVTLNPIITFATIAILMALEISWVTHENFTVLSVSGALMVVAGAILTIRKKS